MKCLLFCRREGISLFRFSRLFALVVAVMIYVCGTASAESMVFVDANDQTGYYVDQDSISKVDFTDKDGTHKFVRARIAVIRADLNRRYIYAMQFEPAKMTYQIFASEVQAYDTKESIESHSTGGLPRPYTSTSMLKEIVDFILAMPTDE
jgi:hypothetical protein